MASSATIASLIESAFPSEAEGIVADLGGDNVENLTWMRTLLQRLQSAQAELERESANRENERINHEQRLNDLEAQFLAVSQTNTELKVKVEAQQSQAQARDEELRTAQANAAAATEKCSQLATELSLQKQKAAFVAQENEVLASAADRKQTTIDQLRDELASAQRAATENAESQSSTTVDLFAERSDSNLRAKVEFLEKERDLLRDANTLLEERLTHQTTQLFQTKESLTARNSELEAVIPKREAEIESLTGRLEATQKQNENLTASLEAARATMRDMQEEHSAKTAALAQKAASFEELAGKLQSSLENAESQVQSLRDRHEQFRKTADARKADSEELLRTFERDISAKSKTITDLQNTIKRLENDVTLRAHASGSARITGTSSEPSAMIQKLVEHTGSGTLSDWYKRIVTAEEELDKNVKEKEHLHQLMNNILAAIEQQGPVLKAQSDDYKRALESQQALADQVRQLDAENERLREQNGSFEELQAQHKALKMTMATLEESNRHLLWAIEGGGRVKPNADAMSQALLRTDDAGLDDAVRKHLPEYSSLAELSIKHSQLIQAYNEASVRTSQYGADAKRTAEIQEQVSHFKKQLELLVKSRERSQQEIQSLIQQRDALQIALTNKDRSYLLQVSATSSAKSVQSSVDSSPAQSSPTLSAELSSAKHKLKLLQDQFEQYKQQRIASDEQQSQQLRQARNEANSAARDLSVANRNIEIFKERAEDLKQAVAAARAEATEERAKHTKTFENLLAQQAAATKISVAREQDHIELARLRASASNLKAQESLSKAECERMQARVADLEQRLKAQGSLLDKVQSIESAVAAQKQSELARVKEERDESRRTSAELSRTVESLRTDVQRLEASARASAKEHAEQLEVLRAAAQDAKDNAASTKTELAAAREKYKSLAAQHDALQAHIGGLKRRQSIRANAAASVLESADGQSGGSASAVSTLDVPDSQVAEEAAATITRQATDIQELQVLLKSTEDAFESQHSTIEQQEATIKSLEGQVTQLESQVATLQTSVEQSKSTAEQLQTELVNVKSTSEKSISELQKQVDAANERVASCDEREDALRSSIQEQKATADAAQERYRHEHKEHEKDMQLLEQTSAEVEKLRTELSETKVSTAAAIAEAQAAAASKASEADALAKRLAARDQEVADMEAQNALLHRQMAALDRQIERAREASLDVTRDTRPEDFALASSGSEGGADGAAEEISRLKAMLKFHKEKHSVVNTKLGLQTKLVDELQRRVRSLETSLRQAEEEAAQAASSASATSTAEEHAKILADVEQLHLLRESNQHLRRELKTEQHKTAQLNVRLADAEKRLKNDSRDEKLKQLAATNAELERRAKQAETDSKMYKQQAQNVVANIDMIDPAKHKRIVELHKSAKAELGMLRKRLAAAASKTANLQKQVTQAEEAEKAQQTSSNKLREALRKMQKDLAVLKANDAKLKKEVQQQKQRNTNLADALKKARKAMTTKANIQSPSPKKQGQKRPLSGAAQPAQKKMNQAQSGARPTKVLHKAAKAFAKKATTPAAHASPLGNRLGPKLTAASKPFVPGSLAQKMARKRVGSTGAPAKGPTGGGKATPAATKGPAMKKLNSKLMMEQLRKAKMKKSASAAQSAALNAGGKNAGK